MDKRTLITLSLLLYIINIGYSQSANFNYSEAFELKSTYFVSPDEDISNTLGFITILNDQGTEPLSEYIVNSTGQSRATEVWNNTGKIKPAAYISNYNGRGGAVIAIKCETEATLYARGEGTDGYDLPIKEIELGRYRRGLLSTYNTSTNAYTPKPFPENQVQFWERFEMTWFVSNDEDLPHDQWVEIGISTSPLYVTHDAPLVGVNPDDPNQDIYETQILHSTLNLSCRATNDNITADDIVANAYQQFMSKCIKPVNDDGTINQSASCMGYWKDIATANQCTSVADLLTNGDARCQEWANFYNDMVRLQGIDRLRIAVITPEPDIISGSASAEYITDLQNAFINPGCLDFNGPSQDPQTPLLFVKNWDFSSDPSFFKGPRLDIPEPDCIAIQDLDDDGVEAQGGNENLDPIASDFTNHAIVKDTENDLYYDPSYGLTPSSSVAIYENKTMDGYGGFPRIAYIGADGDMYSERFYWLYRSNDTGVNQITINP